MQRMIDDDSSDAMLIAEPPGRATTIGPCAAAAALPHPPPVAFPGLSVANSARWGCAYGRPNNINTLRLVTEASTHARLIKKSMLSDVHGAILRVGASCMSFYACVAS